MNIVFTSIRKFIRAVILLGVSVVVGCFLVCFMVMDLLQNPPRHG